MAFTHLFFDLDGTLTDSRPGIFNSANYAAGKLGIPLAQRPADLTPFIGPPLRESFRLVFGLGAADAELAVKYYREYYGQEGMYQYRIYEGITESLEALQKNGLRLSVITSKAEIYASEIILISPLNRFFDIVSGCELNGNRSEKGELILYNCQRLGIKPGADVLMIGDRYHDLRGAAQAGVSSAAVTYGYGSEDELVREKPAMIIKSPYQLADEILKYQFSKK